MDGRTLPSPSTDASELRRVEHTRQRRRLLYSQFEADLAARIQQKLGSIRADVLGQPDLTANPYLSIWSQVAVLYNDAPSILTPAGSDGIVSLVDAAGYWPQMQRVQRDTLALRNMLVAVELDENGEVAYRPVFPDMVTARGSRRRPNVAESITELRPVPGLGWCHYTHDISDPANPRYTVTTPEGADVSADALGGNFSGVNYPCLHADGRPELPFVFYNAAETGYLFDPYTYREVVEGSLNIGVLLTYYQHLVRNAAWAQRWMLGARVRGTEPRGDQAAERQEIVTDPATVLQLDPTEDTTNSQIGQWNPPSDPESVLRSIAMYERRILLLAGLQPPDVTRQEADVRSGYSLAVSRDTVREAQRCYEPAFRKSDQRLFAITACLLNRATGSGDGPATAYSEIPADYRISYQGLPETPDEVAAKLAMLKAKQEAGLVGPVTAYLEIHPTVTRDEAVLKLAAAATEKGDVEAAITALTSARSLLRGDAPETPPQVVPLAPGSIQAAQQIVTDASAGRMAAETARELLISVVGLTPQAANAITATIKPPSVSAPPAA